MRVAFIVAIVAVALAGQSFILKHLSKPRSIAEEPTTSAAYNLVNQVLKALHDHDKNLLASVLADDGYFTVEQYGCNAISKEQMLKFADDEAQYSSSQGIPGEWTQSDDGVTIVNVEVAAVFDKTANKKKSSNAEILYVPEVYYVAVANAAGTQLTRLERRSNKTDPSSDDAAMLKVWDNMVAANKAGNIGYWAPAITQSFTYTRHYTDGLKPVQRLDRDQFLEAKAAEYKDQTLNDVKTRAAFASCNRIFVSGMTFKDGKTKKSSDVQKLFANVELAPQDDSTYLIQSIEEWALGLPPL